MTAQFGNVYYQAVMLLVERYAGTHNFGCAVVCQNQTKFLYWAMLVDSVTRLQLPADLVKPVNQLSRNLSPLKEFCLNRMPEGNQMFST